ncbi:MAG: glutamine-hydrolyzing carbamoyl-phosphate synthase small subunit [Acidimicrobiia bacterium]|nr:glutamine-hydrolyzing carbamoyl-phosphate synthase small subunit [Acidimicrobiia bacterium]
MLLVTADGAVFRGTRRGASGPTTGEVVFNTAMTGYQEIVTDPSYAGQVVVLTAPHIGNYGSSDADDQSDSVHARALVTRSMSRIASSWRSGRPFTEYLTDRGVVAITDVDTRRLTRHIAQHGAMPVAIGADVDEAELRTMAASAPTMDGAALAASVSTPRRYRSPATTKRVGHVVAYDLGIKRDIIRQLNDRGLDVTVVPWDTVTHDVLNLEPTGVFLSNGPGDPEPLTATVTAVRGLLGVVPVFGICLGHQILGQAVGARTFKLPFGHHAGNHPVRDLRDGTVAITSQNHGFAVDMWSLGNRKRPAPAGMPGPDRVPPVVQTEFGAVQPTHQNLNDGTNEGLDCIEANAFSVQYHPEAAPGPNDATGLFDEFLVRMGVADAQT